MKTFGGTGYEQANCIINTTDGDYLVVGNGTDFMGLAYKLNISGGIIWKKGFDTKIQSVCNANDNAYIVMGHIDRSVGNKANSDVWLSKIDSKGKTVWANTYGGSDLDESYMIINTLDNGHLFVGSTFSSDGDISINHGGRDVWVVKIGESGEIAWEKTYGGAGWEEAFCVKQLPDMSYVIVGKSDSYNDFQKGHFRNDFYIIKISNNGDLLKQKVYGSTGDDYGYSLALTDDNGIVIAGEVGWADGEVSAMHGDGGSDIWVIKTDQDLNLIWEKSYGGYTWDQEPYIIKKVTGVYTFACQTTSNDGDVSGNHGQGDIWLVDINEQGNILNNRCFGGTGFDMPKSIITNSNGGIIVAGSSDSQDGDVTGNNGGNDFWIISTSVK